MDPLVVLDTIFTTFVPPCERVVYLLENNTGRGFITGNYFWRRRSLGLADASLSDNAW